MGIWDSICSAPGAIAGGVVGTACAATPYLRGGWQNTCNVAGGVVGTARATTPYLRGGWQNTCNIAGVASESAIRTGQAVAERMPDREGWERIGQLGLRIADHAIEDAIKRYTFAIPLYKYAKQEFRKYKTLKQPVKDAKENRELDAHKGRIDYQEKDITESQELKIRMQTMEKELAEIKQNCSNQKTEKRPKSRDWCPPELIDLIKIQ